MALNSDENKPADRENRRDIGIRSDQQNIMSLPHDDLVALFVTHYTNEAFFTEWVRPDENKNQIHRIDLFRYWLDATGRHWSGPDLRAYAAYLRSSNRQIRQMIEDGIAWVSAPALSASSVNSHLASIRGYYRRVREDRAFLEGVHRLADHYYPTASLADRDALVRQLLTSIHIPPGEGNLTVTTQQDRIDNEHLRLSIAQAEHLISKPGTSTYMGLRDTAMIALMLCTGLREAEVAGLCVRDLRVESGGELGVHVREGKGAKGRFVPYGELAGVLTIVENWLYEVGLLDISEVPAFQGFTNGYIGGKRLGDLSEDAARRQLRGTSISPRALQDVLKRYPIDVDGVSRTVRPHDLRRTYARRLYDVGVPVVEIQQNLGHANLTTTQDYIGNLEMHKRRPPALFRLPMMTRRR